MTFLSGNALRLAVIAFALLGHQAWGATTTPCVLADKIASNQNSYSYDERYFAGLVYYTEYFGCKNVPRAEQIFLSVAMDGHVGAQFQLCDLKAFQGDAESAVAWCYVSAELGGAQAKERLKTLHDITDRAVFEDGVAKGSELLTRIGSRQ